MKGGETKKADLTTCRNRREFNKIIELKKAAKKGSIIVFLEIKRDADRSHFSFLLSAVASPHAPLRC